MRSVRRALIVPIVVVLAVAGAALPFRLAGSADARVARLEVVSTKLAADGSPVEVASQRFYRVYSDGEFSFSDLGETFSGKADGSADRYATSSLPLADGLVDTGGGRKPLPVDVSVTATLDGKPVEIGELSGANGTIRLEIAVVNRTVRTQKLTYRDSATDADRTIYGVTASPMTVNLRGARLDDAAVDELDTNAALSRPDDKVTALDWSAVLAPPMYPAATVFFLEAKALDFHLPAMTLTVEPGAPPAPAAVATAADQGGSQAATLGGYVEKFAGGFEQLGGGLDQIKAGLDQVLAGIRDELKPGLDNPTFDKVLFAEDSKVDGNSPGLRDGLEVLGDGLDTLKAGIGQLRAGLASGDPSNPGVTEGLQLLGSGATQLSAALRSASAADPGVAEGLQLIRGGITQVQSGLFNTGASTPGAYQGLQLIAGGIRTVRSGLRGTPPSTDDMTGGLQAILAGVAQLSSGIGDGTEFDGENPLTVQASMVALRGGAQQLLGGATTLFGAVGDGTEFDGADPLTVQASLAAMRGGLESLTAGVGALHDAIGDGSELADLDADGQVDDPVTIAASLAKGRQAIQALQAFYTTGTPGSCPGGAGTCVADLLSDGAFVPVCTGLATALGLDPVTCTSLSPAQQKTILALLAGPVTGDSDGDGQPDDAFNALVDGIGTGTEFGPDANGDGRPDPLTVRAALNVVRGALESGDPANPGLSEGLARLTQAIGTGSEFGPDANGDGRPDPLTVRAALTAIRAGLQSGDAANPGMAEGLTTLVSAIGTGSEFGPDGNGDGRPDPLTVRAALTAIRAGLQSGDAANPGVSEGLSAVLAALGDGTEYDCTGDGEADASCTPESAGALPVSVIAALDTFAGGIDRVRTGLGTGTEFVCGTTPCAPTAAGAQPASVMAALNAFSAGIGTILGGIGTGAEFDCTGDGVADAGCTAASAGATPLTLTAGLAGLRNGADQLVSQGTNVMVEALGDLGPDGTAVKAVEVRRTRFGHDIEDPTTALWGLQSAINSIDGQFIGGIDQILAALGDPSVKGATVLSGLQQLSDGLAAAGAGAQSGADGANTVAGVASRSAASGDASAALAKAGTQRADKQASFTPTDPEFTSRLLFSFSLPAI